MKKLVVRLKGGLGNQMFQYAAGRALALKNGMRLVLDIESGFARDKVYQRTYSLNRFPFASEFASSRQQIPFWYEQVRNRLFPEDQSLVQQRPWGLYIHETDTKYLKDIEKIIFNRNTFMEGYWQSERYFADHKEIIGREFSPPVSKDDLFLSMAKKIEKCSSVSIGVRLFEEVPGESKQGVGGLVPYAFYEEAAIQIAERVNNPTFFIFCTREDSVHGKLNLPGDAHYLTHDNGYQGEMSRLWLISRCAHHILSNSSFYWWGAWLAEQIHSESIIISCDQFTNLDCIPNRWLTIKK